MAWLSACLFCSNVKFLVCFFCVACLLGLGEGAPICLELRHRLCSQRWPPSPWGSQFVGECFSLTLGTCYAPKDVPHNLGDPSLLGNVFLSPQAAQSIQTMDAQSTLFFRRSEHCSSTLALGLGCVFPCHLPPSAIGGRAKRQAFVFLIK